MDHAKQFNRHYRQLRLLRTRLGRIIRDIRRKIAGHADIEALFGWPLTHANQICSQQQRQRGWKLYSFHATEVGCVGKGKASAPCKFGVKVAIVTTNASLDSTRTSPRLRNPASPQSGFCTANYQACISPGEIMAHSGTILLPCLSVLWTAN